MFYLVNFSFHPRDAAQRVERNSVVVIVNKNETIKLYTREKNTTSKKVVVVKSPLFAEIIIIPYKLSYTKKKNE